MAGAHQNNVMAWLDLIVKTCDERGMKNAGDIDIVKSRLQEVQQERADLERRLAENRQEESDLEVTVRTLARLYKVAAPEVGPVVADASRRGKPSDIPTVPDMAETIMREQFDLNRKLWMEQQDIVQAIRQRWWPDAETNDITPTLWRVATKQEPPRFLKDGTKYAIPEYVKSFVGNDETSSTH